MDAPAAFVPQAALERVAGAPLFYPAARDDCRAAVDLLAPYVTEFWFVDTDYFRSREQSAARAAPLLAGRADYRLLGTHIAGPPCADKERRTDPATGKRYDWLAPCVRTEVYDHCATGRAVTGSISWQ